MKTNEKVLENGMANTLDEVIFANRNRSYGAFELRTKYNRRLMFGFLFGFFVFASGISVPLIQSIFSDETFSKPPKLKVTATLSDLEDQKPLDIPPPADIPIDMKQNRFQVEIVDTLFTDEELPMTVDEIIENTGNEYSELALVPITKTEKDIFDDENKEGLVVVEENASFLGSDLKAFQTWLQSNLNYPSAAEQAGIEGKVFLEFAVNTKGDICDTRITRGLHPSINEECLRVLHSSPKWTPAKQNGSLVKQKFSLNVVFLLSN